MVTLHQLTDNCLAVAGLPSEAEHYAIAKTKNGLFRLLISDEKLTHTDSFEIPTGKWRILGKANDLTEEQWKEVVEFHKLDHGKLFFNYVGDDFLNTATESGASLLQSKGLYLVNPYSLPSCDCNTEYDREGCEEECYQYINAKNISNALILINDLVI